VLALVAATLALLLIAWQNMQNQQRISDTHQWQMRQNCLSAWAQVQSQLIEVEYSKKTKDLFGEERDTITIVERMWGGFRNACFIAQRQKYTHQMALLYGQLTKQNSQQPALYLANQKRGLNIAGNSLLQGNVYLSEKGIKAAYIEGKSYTRERLVYGNILESSAGILETSSQLIAYAQRMGRFVFSPEDSLCEVMPRNLTHDWYKKTAVFQSINTHLSIDTLSGNIIVYSTDSIIISSENMLQDIIICAPKVRVKAEVSGRFHIIASDTVIIEKDVHLNYPSSILLVSSTSVSAPMPQFILGKRSVVSGVIIVSDQHFRRTTNANAFLDSGSVVLGQIYTLGNLEPRGKIFGNAYATKLVLHTRASIYENHLLDAMICADSLQQPFGGLLIKGANQNQQQTPTKKFPAIWLSYPPKP